MGGAVEEVASGISTTLENVFEKGIEFTGNASDWVSDRVEDAVDWVEERVEDAVDWVETQLDYLDGDVADKQKKLEDRSKKLESEVNTFQNNAQLINSRYTKESFLYKDNASFKYVATNADLKYLKYIYPEKMEEYQSKIDQLNADVKAFEDKYGGGFLGTKDWLGSWAGDIITGVAVAVGNVLGFITGKDISFEDALKSAVMLVILYFTWEAGADKAVEVSEFLGLEATQAVVMTIQVVIMTITLDTMFAGSKGLIEVLNVFGQIFDGLGLTDGNSVFNKFFDSFKKDSDYNGYLVFAVQMLIAYYTMPNFDTLMAKEYATIYAGYNAINAVDSIIKARIEYQQQKEEYETKLEQTKKDAVDTERSARLSKLSSSMIEGDDIVNGTWWNQYAGMQGWMTFDRPNGLFYGIKDSPDDIMFKYDLYAVTHPSVRSLGVMPERLI